MAALSDFLENELLDHTLGTGVAFGQPAGTFLALFTTDPTDAGTGTEVTGAGYARQAATFSVAAVGSTSNSATVTFTAAGGSFGTVGFFGIYDAVTLGNLLWHGALSTPRLINDTESLIFSTGALTVSMD